MQCCLHVATNWYATCTYVCFMPLSTYLTCIHFQHARTNWIENKKIRYKLKMLVLVHAKDEMGRYRDQASRRERETERTGEKETEIAQIQSNARDRGSEKERGEQRKEFDVKQTWSYYSTSRYNSISSKFFFFLVIPRSTTKGRGKAKKNGTKTKTQLFPRRYFHSFSLGLRQICHWSTNRDKTKKKTHFVVVYLGFGISHFFPDDIFIVKSIISVWMVIIILPFCGLTSRSKLSSGKKQFFWCFFSYAIFVNCYYLFTPR